MFDTFGDMKKLKTVVQHFFNWLNARAVRWGGLIALLGIGAAILQCCQNCNVKPDYKEPVNKLDNRPIFNNCNFINMPNAADERVRTVLTKVGTGDISPDGSDEYLLAGMYYWGVMVDVDRLKAFKYVRNAAYKNNREALFELGVYYFQGVGTERNLTRSFDCFRRSAELGCPRAEVMLGYAYQFGLGFTVQTDAKKGFDYFLRSANSGYPLAYFCVGYCYAIGCGCDRDVDRAKSWLLKAKESGDAKIVEMVNQTMELVQ